MYIFQCHSFAHFSDTFDANDKLKMFAIYINVFIPLAVCEKLTVGKPKYFSVSLH